MAVSTSAFMLIFRESTPERYEEMTREERQEHLARWNQWCDGLASEGKLQHGHPLQASGRIVSARGKRSVDGPFAEAKELVGGYLLLTAEGIEEATGIAEQCPLLPFGMEVEVRPVAGGCHLAQSLGWETMRGPAAV